MTFTLVWKRRALNQLAEIWLKSDQRENISTAASELERLLRHDPETQGESRQGNDRVIVVGPLVVLFEVQGDDRMIRILSVLPAHRHPH